MALSLLVGPPGSGRTHAMLARARGPAGPAGVVGGPAGAARPPLPARHHGDGADAGAQALLGLEFLTLQQLYYRLLARARGLHPLIVGSGRLVLVGEALAEVPARCPRPARRGSSPRP